MLLYRLLFQRLPGLIFFQKIAGFLLSRHIDRPLHGLQVKVLARALKRNG